MLCCSSFDNFEHSFSCSSFRLASWAFCRRSCLISWSSDWSRSFSLSFAVLLSMYFCLSTVWIRSAVCFSWFCSSSCFYSVAASFLRISTCEQMSVSWVRDLLSLTANSFSTFSDIISIINSHLTLFQFNQKGNMIKTCKKWWKAKPRNQRPQKL